MGLDIVFIPLFSEFVCVTLRVLLLDTLSFLGLHSFEKFYLFI